MTDERVPALTDVEAALIKMRVETLDRRVTQFEGEIKAMAATLQKILVAVATSAVLLAINLAMGLIGG